MCLSSSSSKDLAESLPPLPPLLPSLQLDQMDLEIHDVAAEVRPQCTQRLRTYKKELDRLKKEFVRMLTATNNRERKSSPSLSPSLPLIPLLSLSLSPSLLLLLLPLTAASSGGSW